MTYLVTGTSGHLGRLVVEALLRRGVPAGQIVATARNLDSIADLAAAGVVVRRADYTDPQSLKEAFVGVDRALLVSGNEFGQRVAHHRNVIDAAADAGVALLAYTSIAKAQTSAILLAPEHKETEDYLRASGVPHVLLRNGWYVENWSGQTATHLEHGAVLGSTGEGRVSAATRADYAEAAAAVLTSEEQAGKVYELGGTAFTLTEYAAALSEVSDQTVTYQDLPLADYTGVLVSAGLPEPIAAVFADGDRAIKDGELYIEGNDLDTLIGRPSTPLREALKAALV